MPATNYSVAIRTAPKQPPPLLGNGLNSCQLLPQANRLVRTAGPIHSRIVPAPRLALEISLPKAVARYSGERSSGGGARLMPDGDDNSLVNCSSSVVKGFLDKVKPVPEKGLSSATIKYMFRLKHSSMRKSRIS